MSENSEPSTPASDASRLTLVMAFLFSASGMLMVFLPRWLAGEHGLNGGQIGAVLSLAQLTRILTGPLIAAWADATPDRNAPLRLVSAATIAAFAAFFFLAHGFWSLLLLGLVALSLMQAMTPLVEAGVLRATAHGKLSYGVARGVGSISFIVATTAGGALVSRFGPGAVVVWTLAAFSMAAASAWLGLRREAHISVVRTPGEGMNAFAALLRQRGFLLLIVSCGLIQSAHAFYYGFSTLVWQAQGLDDATAGMLWGFGVAVEVVFLLCLSPIERHVSPQTLILAGAAGGVARWLIMGFGPVGLVLWPLQALHMLSFAAAHVGAMRLLYRAAPERAAMAQTLYAGLSGGLFMGASSQFSGILYDLHGARGYWLMAALAALGGALALRIAPPKTATSA
ncbi:MAG: MFS transporter [Terricaulis sp.]